MRIRKIKTKPSYIVEEMIEPKQEMNVDTYTEDRDSKLIKRYKSILDLDEDFEITEENLDDWALKHACMLEGASYDRAKQVILGRKFEGYDNAR